MEKYHRANAKALDDLLPTVRRWAAGEGDAAAVKRFGRRRELQLLVLEPAEMPLHFSAYQWTQLMTSGLERHEVRAIAASLRRQGVPSQAAGFTEIVRERVFGFGEPTPAELAGADAPQGDVELARRSQKLADLSRCLRVEPSANAMRQNASTMMRARQGSRCRADSRPRAGSRVRAGSRGRANSRCRVGSQ